ncbi:kinase A anchor protein [Fennellomyces sp. T-0311]|nr:kinase A anchor protein [Fennellomyces sp. T-0311]
MIKGTQDKVEKAIATIDQLVQEAYEKARPTHFLSLPIASTFATRKLEEFQSSILSSTFKSDGLEPSIMVSPANIHITLGVLKLLHKSDVDRAVRFLKEECPKVIRENMVGRGLSVHLRNIAIMQSNPEKKKANAHVLYIEPNEENQDQQPLRKLCLALIDKMVQAGLMVPDDRPLKASGDVRVTHVTLINTANRSGKDRKRQAFDARPILKQFPHLDLGTVPLDKLHLMKMGRTGKGGTYESQGSIPIEP